LNIIADSNTNILLQSKVEAFLKTVPHLVSQYAYMSEELRFGVDEARPDVTNIGQYKAGQQRVHAVTPNFLDTTGTKFLKINKVQKANPPAGVSRPLLGSYEYSWSIDEQLYSKRGSSQLILGATYIEYLGLRDFINKFLFRITYKTEQYPKFVFKMLKPLAFLAGCPVLTFSVFPLVNNQDTMVSFPTFVRLSDGRYKSVRDVPIQKIFIKTDDNIDGGDLQYLKSELQHIVGPEGLRVKDVEDDLRPLAIASQVMDFFFLFTTCVAMTICFFSLVSSMYSNVNEQAKEIGILRAIGTRKFTVVRIFVYESFVLILSSSFMGIFIGAVVGYTMNLQNGLFTQLPIDFVFPWKIVLMVFGMAIVSGLFASLFPVVALLTLPVVTILRRLVT